MVTPSRSGRRSRRPARATPADRRRRRGPAMRDETPPTPHAWRHARFMVIVAHPDDADFGPAATAARWIDEGSTGWLVCCTSGDAGNDDWRTDPLEPGALRE